MEEYKEPLILSVKYALMNEFLELVRREELEIKKVVELVNCEVLQYWIDCPKEKENLITDYAFMTFIKNPVFQKYYHGTKAFEEIAEKYIKEREEKLVKQS